MGPMGARAAPSREFRGGRGDESPVSAVGLQSAVEASECAGKHQRHDQDAGSEREHVRVLAQVEAADATDEQVGDGKVEQAPKDIDRRGGQAFAGRRCEGTLEGIARYSIDKMGHCVGQECAPEEVGDVMIPAHDRDPFQSRAQC